MNKKMLDLNSVKIGQTTPHLLLMNKYLLLERDLITFYNLKN